MTLPTPYPGQQVPQDNHLIQELGMPIYPARGWLKFLGVLSIITGVGQALTLVGILWAWLPIWMGVLMYQAGSSLEMAGLGDRFAFMRSLSSLKTYFVLQGVLSLIGIVLALTILCVMFVLPLLGLTLVPWQDILKNINFSY